MKPHKLHTFRRKFGEKLVFCWQKGSGSSCVEVAGLGGVTPAKMEAILPCGAEAGVTGDNWCYMETAQAKRGAITARALTSRAHPVPQAVSGQGGRRGWWWPRVPGCWPEWPGGAQAAELGWGGPGAARAGGGWRAPAAAGRRAPGGLRKGLWLPLPSGAHRAASSAPQGQLRLRKPRASFPRTCSVRVT